MWTCPKCNRKFKRTKQQHSCKTIPLEQHFKNKEYAKSLYNYLIKKIKSEIGNYNVISLPCCIHLYGNYDFLAILPHRDSLEIRFAYENEIRSKRIVQTVSLSKKLTKNVIYIKKGSEIDTELLNWLKISYFLKI